MKCLFNCDECAGGENPSACDVMRRRRRDSAATGVLALAVLVAAIAACVLLCGGCASESAKVVEGTDLSVGFSIPGAEGEANFTVFNWLSGFKTTTAESSRVKLRYTCAETNDYFGAVHTRTYKTVDAEITPVVDEAEEGEKEGGDGEDDKR